MLINPAVLAVATVVALVVARVAGLNPVPILAAAGIALIASEMAVLPMVLGRSKQPADVFIKAFGGTVIHLGLFVMMGAIGILGSKLGNVFVYWLIGAYWITLIGLCTILIRVLRSPNESAKLSTN